MLTVWTKRLGQKHYAEDNSNTTVCGKPMLGNNYANIIPENEQKECSECAKILENRGISTKHIEGKRIVEMDPKSLGDSSFIVRDNKCQDRLIEYTEIVKMIQRSKFTEVRIGKNTYLLLV